MKITETTEEYEYSNKQQFYFMIFLAVMVVVSGICCLFEETPENLEMEPNNRELTAESYLLFETGDKEEYLQFLNYLDASGTHELSFVSIDTFNYSSPYVNYSVMYKKCTGEKNQARYEYYLFETDTHQKFFESGPDFEKRKEEDFWSFLDNDLNYYEVVDISVGTSCYRSDTPQRTYFITYRKPV